MAKTLAQGRKPGSGRKPGKGKTLREGRKPGSGRRRKQDSNASNIIASSSHNMIDNSAENISSVINPNNNNYNLNNTYNTGSLHIIHSVNSINDNLMNSQNNSNSNISLNLKNLIHKEPLARNESNSAIDFNNNSNNNTDNNNVNRSIIPTSYSNDNMLKVVSRNDPNLTPRDMEAIDALRELTYSPLRWNSYTTNNSTNNDNDTNNNDNNNSSTNYNNNAAILNPNMNKLQQPLAMVSSSRSTPPIRNNLDDNSISFHNNNTNNDNKIDDHNNINNHSNTSINTNNNINTQASTSNIVPSLNQIIDNENTNLLPTHSRILQQSHK